MAEEPEQPITNRISVRLRRRTIREARVKCTCGSEEDVGRGELTDSFVMKAGIKRARQHNAQVHNNTYRIFAVTEREIK